MNYSPEKLPGAAQRQDDEHFIPVKNINSFLDSDEVFTFSEHNGDDSAETLVTFEVIRKPEAIENKAKSNPPEPAAHLPEALSMAPPDTTDTPAGTTGSLSDTKDFHFTVELPGKVPPTVPNRTPGRENREMYYLEIPSVHYANDSRDEYDVETMVDIDLKASTRLSDTTVDFDINTAPAANPPGAVKQESEPFLSSDSIEVGIDEVLTTLVTREPFLSEIALFSLLKDELPCNFNLSRRVFRTHLRKNGLDTGYKRFRAYITG